ncbi:S1 family peptidase [Bradyrhizobium sp.]|uniref:S1 family peptidase n=1 Tax=Bradyrhizobium sp. TaxID=376 RepID=UPI003C1A09A3
MVGALSKSWLFWSSLLLVGLDFCSAGFSQPVPAENFDNALLVYAVNIHRTPVQSWPGSGIYLGNGVFITAAHVVGTGWWTRPKVVIEGQEYPTLIVKEGSLETTDLTLLSVDEKLLPSRLQLRRNPLCKKEPWPGEDVVTVVPKSTARSRVLDPKYLPANVRQFSTVIGDPARTGNSGSGVFDTLHRCLLGIISRKITISRAVNGKTQKIDVAKYFVPASTIAQFIPAELQN